MEEKRDNKKKTGWWLRGAGEVRIEKRRGAKRGKYR